MAIASGAEVYWIGMLFHDLQIPLSSSSMLWCHNTGALKLAYNGRLSVYLRKDCQQYKIYIYISTADQIANIIFTRVLHLSIFFDLLMIRTPPIYELERGL
jgi:DNA-binding sugar fermentation-stimulating protein